VLSYFQGGADDNDPPTCFFIVNALVCVVCPVFDAGSCETEDYLLWLFQMRPSNMEENTIKQTNIKKAKTPNFVCLTCSLARWFISFVFKFATCTTLE